MIVMSYADSGLKKDPKQHYFWPLTLQYWAVTGGLWPLLPDVWASKHWIIPVLEVYSRMCALITCTAALRGCFCAAGIFSNVEIWLLKITISLICSRLAVRTRCSQCPTPELEVAFVPYDVEAECLSYSS